MTRRSINTALHATAIGLALMAALAFAVGVALPIESPQQALDGGQETGAAGTSVSLPSPASLERVSAMRLQDELGPTQPQLAAEATRVPSNTAEALPVNLVGTIGDSLAILRRGSGAIEVRGVGENLDGVEVLSIRPGCVQVRANGQVSDLTKATGAESEF